MNGLLRLCLLRNRDHPRVLPGSAFYGRLLLRLHWLRLHWSRESTVEQERRCLRAFLLSRRMRTEHTSEGSGAAEWLFDRWCGSGGAGLFRFHIDLLAWNRRFEEIRNVIRAAGLLLRPHLLFDRLRRLGFRRHRRLRRPGWLRGGSFHHELARERSWFLLLSRRRRWRGRRCIRLLRREHARELARLLGCRSRNRSLLHWRRNGRGGETGRDGLRPGGQIFERLNNLRHRIE